MSDQLYLNDFINDCRSLGITLDDNVYNQFYRFWEILVEWNKFMNLTGITDLPDVIKKHFIDSLAVYFINDKINFLLNKDISIIDIGTGAGFPGIPLKLVSPAISITLLDSLSKRIKFLNHVINDLELSDINAFHGRAEEFANNINYREKYDICVSRAVAAMPVLAEYCLPFVKCGGYFISYKTSKVYDELENSKNGLNILGGEIVDVVKFYLPNSDIERVFVIIKKVKECGKKYPRNYGIINKRPLW